MNGPLLVASDGSEESSGALRLARALHDRDGTAVEVLTVVEPLPVLDAGFLPSLGDADLQEARRQGALERVRDRLAAVGGSALDWPVSVSGGLAPAAMVERADEVGAQAVLLGLGRHRALDRVFGTETVLQLLRIAHLPVLAVPTLSGAAPDVAVLGVDFSDFSLRAGRAALRVLDRPATVHLLHVMAAPDALPGLSEAWRDDYRSGAARRLEEFAAQLGAPGGWDARIHVREGEPAAEILALAAESGAGLIAMGSHGHSFIGRLLTGSVSTDVIRGAGIAVLAMPPEAPVPAEDRRGAGGRGEAGRGAPGGSGEPAAPRPPESPSHPWVALLSGFTERNAQRSVSLEIREAALGALHEGRGFPFRGASYDPRHDRLDLMLGGTGAGADHLTHSIPSPLRLEVVRDDRGRDDALHVEYGGGTAVLRIDPPDA